MALAVKIITPVCVDSTDIARREQRYRDAVGPGVFIRVFNVPEGPTRLSCKTDLQQSEESAIRVGEQTDPTEFDAILFDCVFDRGLDRLRERSPIPVFGPMSFTLGVLEQIAQRFSVVVRTPAHKTLLHGSLIEHQAGARLRRIELLGISDDESREPGRYDAAMLPVVRALVAEDPSQALLLGSTTMDITPAIRNAAGRMRLIHPSLFAIDGILSLARRGALAPRKKGAEHY